MYHQVAAMLKTKTKEQIVQMAKNEHVSTDGSKLDLCVRVAVSQEIKAERGKS